MMAPKALTDSVWSPIQNFPAALNLRLGLLVDCRDLRMGVLSDHAHRYRHVLGAAAEVVEAVDGQDVVQVLHGRDALQLRAEDGVVVDRLEQLGPAARSRLEGDPEAGRAAYALGAEVGVSDDLLGLLLRLQIGHGDLPDAPVEVVQNRALLTVGDAHPRRDAEAVGDAAHVLDDLRVLRGVLAVEVHEVEPHASGQLYELLGWLGHREPEGLLACAHPLQNLVGDHGSSSGGPTVCRLWATGVYSPSKLGVKHDRAGPRQSHLIRH